VLYSTGNEIHDTPKPELAKEILGGLIEVFHQADPTRPVTQALFRPNVSHDYDNGLADMLDVVGQNYRENEILAAHSAKPSRKIVGTENGQTPEVWRPLRDNPPYAGQFLWAGIDYLGESRRWPTVSSASGLLDRTGGVKPQGYQRASWWSGKPMVRMARRVAAELAGPVDPGYEAAARRRLRTLYMDWTPANTAAHEEDVEVYSNCEEVELYLNGKSLGSKSLPADASPRSWRVPYEAGAIRAVGRNAGREAATQEMRTAGPATAIVLASDRATLSTGWDDVAYVTATVVDASGVVAPGAAVKIAFEVSGPGVLAAVDNADASSIEPFQASERTVFDGQCIAILRASAPGGQIALKATAAGLAAGSIKIKTAGEK
jgi:beta-galactosidase